MILKPHCLYHTICVLTVESNPLKMFVSYLLSLKHNRVVLPLFFKETTSSCCRKSSTDSFKCCARSHTFHINKYWHLAVLTGGKAVKNAETFASKRLAK